MSETLIRWPTCAAALAAVLALGAWGRSPQAAPALQFAHTPPAIQLASYGHGRGGLYDHRAHDVAAVRERTLAYRRLIAREHWRRAHHRDLGRWDYRHHHLKFEQPERRGALHHDAIAHPGHAPVSSQPAATPAAPPPAHPATLIRAHRSRLQVTPAARPVLQPTGSLAPVTLALPLLSPQPSPAASPDQAAAAPAVDLATQLGQLTTAVAEIMKGAKLDVPAALSTGAEGKVVLTLPPELLASAQASAGQVGLRSAARKVFVTAKLAGQGYVITPNVEQTARLETGEPTVFNWDVKPSATPGGVLTADMTGSLQGGGDNKTFALGAVTAQIAVAGQAVPATAPIQAPATTPMHLKLPDLGHLNLGALKAPSLSSLHLQSLSIPGHPMLAIPGLGQVASYKVVAVGILALILILLISIMRSANARRERAERRRRFHSFEANHFGDEHS